jgi:beta-glucanase (GH16 family)
LDEDSFTDGFEAFNAKRWAVGQHQLGRSALSAANVGVGGGQTHTETRALGFDPTAAPHDYEIKWGPGRVTFQVDGVALRTWTTGVPAAPMNLFANAWFPAWLDGLASSGPRAAVFDQIRMR